MKTAINLFLPTVWTVTSELHTSVFRAITSGIYLLDKVFSRILSILLSR